MSAAPMSRTAAIKAARRHVTIGAFGGQYVVYRPHSFDWLDGPGTASTPRDWWQTRATCTRDRAALALYLMGVTGVDWIVAEAEIERAHSDGITTLDELVKHVAERLVHA